MTEMEVRDLMERLVSPLSQGGGLRNRETGLYAMEQWSVGSDGGSLWGYSTAAPAMVLALIACGTDGTTRQRAQASASGRDTLHGMMRCVVGSPEWVRSNPNRLGRPPGLTVMSRGFVPCVGLAPRRSSGLMPEYLDPLSICRFDDRSVRAFCEALTCWRITGGVSANLRDVEVTQRFVLEFAERVLRGNDYLLPIAAGLTAEPVSARWYEVRGLNSVPDTYGILWSFLEWRALALPEAKNAAEVATRFDPTIYAVIGGLSRIAAMWSVPRYVDRARVPVFPSTDRDDNGRCYITYSQSQAIRSGIVYESNAGDPLAGWGLSGLPDVEALMSLPLPEFREQMLRRIHARYTIGRAVRLLDQIWTSSAGAP